MGTHASIHPLAFLEIELRLGHILPAFQILGLHPYLYGTVHKDLLPLIHIWLWDFARAAPI